jgi:uncharacterized membrane protein
MNKTIKHEIKKYFKDIKQLLSCPRSMKSAFIAELQSRIDELGEGGDLTLENIMLEFGTPDQIARNFDTYENLKDLKIKALKYKKKQIFIVGLLSVIILVLIVVLLYLYFNRFGMSLVTRHPF